MAAGLVVLMVALAYDESLARERRQRRKRLSTRAHELLSRRSEARKLAVTWSTRACVLARRWWPRLQEGARVAGYVAVAERKWTVAVARHWWPYMQYYLRLVRFRWLTLESTTGQLLLVCVASVVLAYLIVAYG